MKSRIVAGLLALGFILGEAGPAGPTDPGFAAWWHDGKAELDGYRYTVTRYGQERRGQCVGIYVTEPFSRSKNVKVDDAAKNPGDTYDVLKVNLARDFQTGIYDYNTMTSLFVRSADLEPVKLSFVSTEWCGNVYEELKVNPRTIEQRLSSYFEDESQAREHPRMRGDILEEELFVKLRGLNGDFLRPGESRTVPFVPSAFRRRLTHLELAWTSARIERQPGTREITVPAGRFRTIVYVVSTGNGHEGEFFVESAYPHRIIRWAWTQAARQKEGEANDSGELTGSARLEYWKLHDAGNESYLGKLGLKPVPK